MGALLVDLADLLTTGGIATTIYRGVLPEAPDDAIQLVESGGYPPVQAMRGARDVSTVVEQPTVQITRRSSSYDRNVAGMNAVLRLLDGAGDRTINGTRYGWITAIQPPFDLGRDETHRHLRALNVLVCREPSTATST